MKKILWLALLLTNGTTLWAQQVWTDKRRLLPDLLRNIPTGINISHSPTPVWPELNTDTVNYPGQYVWKHLTTVSTQLGQLQVIAAGSYIWWKDKGWTANIKLDTKDFEELFNCPAGQLKPNRTYTFLKNYRHEDGLYAGDAIWFVLAKAKNGQLYKGIALVETEGELKPKH